jgi:hypothetical protein
MITKIVKAVIRGCSNQSSRPEVFSERQLSPALRVGPSEPGGVVATESQADLRGITGVTDPDNDQVTINVTVVTQDEPVNGLGDGDTSPDAVLRGDSVLLRAERSGKGNGRIYAVHFVAMDTLGGTCAGTLTMGVSYNTMPGSPIIDDGQLYDSTQPLGLLIIPAERPAEAPTARSRRWSSPSGTRRVEEMDLPMEALGQPLRDPQSKDEGLFKSTDGGQTLQNLGQAGIFSAIAIDQRNPQVVYAGQRFGQVIRSLDGGQSFAPASTGLAGAGVHGFAQDARGTLFVWIRGGGLFSSDDFASTWKPVDTGEALRRSGVEAGRGTLVADPRHLGRLYLGNAGVLRIDVEDREDDNDREH